MTGIPQGVLPVADGARGSHHVLENEALVHEAKLLEFQEIASRRKPQDGEAWAFGLALQWGIRYQQEILEWNEWARRQIASRATRRSR